ncbi:hypothetical protein SS50377_20254 [Spironucleus salmonicida]|uniref:Uncharacterized protein n=1 Tax=Spironucleus salmonicida TaxID=348837 RepID=V6LM65_9EUKA|nr:hypothetical protein SS50377_20254 [Spironucleus salmonicida]|eukprot:EST45308.1 Hypothetical protein SS50377_14885 [Spironucleus salmonicida]
MVMDNTVNLQNKVQFNANITNKKLEKQIQDNLQRIQPKKEVVEDQMYNVTLQQHSNEPLSVFLIKPTAQITEITIQNMIKPNIQKVLAPQPQSILKLSGLNLIFKLPEFHNTELQKTNTQSISDFSVVNPQSEQQIHQQSQQIYQVKFSIFERFSKGKSHLIRLSCGQFYAVMTIFIEVKSTVPINKLSSISSAVLFSGRQKSNQILKIDKLTSNKMEFELEMIIKSKLMQYWFDCFLFQGKLDQNLIEKLKVRQRIFLALTKQMEDIFKKY